MPEALRQGIGGSAPGESPRRHTDRSLQGKKSASASTEHVHCQDILVISPSQSTARIMLTTRQHSTSTEPKKAHHLCNPGECKGNTMAYRIPAQYQGEAGIRTE